jgi:hypothetical protein
MAIGRPKAELVVSAEEHAQVSELAATRALPHALVARPQLVLWAAQGESNSMIAERRVRQHTRPIGVGITGQLRQAIDPAADRAAINSGIIIACSFSSFRSQPCWNEIHRPSPHAYGGCQAFAG